MIEIFHTIALVCLSSIVIAMSLLLVMGIVYLIQHAYKDIKNEY